MEQWKSDVKRHSALNCHISILRKKDLSAGELDDTFGDFVVACKGGVLVTFVVEKIA